MIFLISEGFSSWPPAGGGAARANSSRASRAVVAVRVIGVLPGRAGPAARPARLRSGRRRGHCFFFLNSVWQLLQSVAFLRAATSLPLAALTMASVRSFQAF